MVALAHNYWLHAIQRQKKDDSMTQYKKDSAKIEDKFKKVQSLVDAGYSIEQAESILTASDSLADIEFKSLGK